MRHGWGVALLTVVCLACGGQVFADEPELDPRLELLVEQGVITMEQALAVQAEYDRREAGEAVAGMGRRQQGSRSRRPGGRAGVPPDIPDGDDDDVVARQLREAAEKETSPELKAKLWEEYRKYKEGMR